MGNLQTNEKENEGTIMVGLCTISPTIISKNPSKAIRMNAVQIFQFLFPICLIGIVLIYQKGISQIRNSGTLKCLAIENKIALENRKLLNSKEIELKINNLENQTKLKFNTIKIEIAELQFTLEELTKTI